MQEHLRMGQAVAPLRDEGVLLFGSGLSYHSMPGFSRNGQISHASSESKARTSSFFPEPSAEALMNSMGAYGLPSVRCVQCTLFSPGPPLTLMHERPQSQSVPMPCRSLTASFRM